MHAIRFKTFRHVTLISFTALAGFAGGVKTYAQTVPALPPSADPGRLIQDKPSLPQTENNAPLPETKPKGEVERFSIPGADQIFIVLRSVTITGMGVYDSAAFTKELDAEIGKKISFSKIIDLLNSINSKYRQDGYIAARAYFPEQDITDGNILIEVQEGILNNVTIENPLHPNSALIPPRLQNLGSGKPLNVINFQQSLLQINDLPGSRFKSVLKPSGTENPGKIDVILLENPVPESTSISLDNYGSQYAGPFQLSFANTEYSVFTPYDQLDAQVTTSAHDDELVFAQAGYTKPSTTIPGLKYFASFSLGKTEAGDRLDPLDIKGLVNETKLEATYDVPLNRTDTARFGAQLDIKNARSQVLDEKLYDDKLRVARFSASSQISDRWKGINFSRLEVSKGLDILGASAVGSDTLSRADGDSGFTKITGQFSRIQNLPQNFQFIGQIQAQYALDPLLTSEEFGFGGSGIGRGYDPSEITGDSGISLSGEMRYNHPLDKFGFQLAQPYAFFDFGKVWQKNNAGAAVSGASAGAGIRLYHVNKFTANFALALPLTLAASNPPPYTSDHGPRFLLSLSKSF